MDEKSKVKGAIFGLLIGDATGVPYEFNQKESLSKLQYIDMIPPNGFARTYPDIKPGTWSDDGAQALCLLDSLTECNGFNLMNFANKLLKWYDNGLWAVDNYVFDVGIQTGQSLNEFRKGISPEISGFIRPDGKGNGSLMRVLPLPVWHKGNDKELVLLAHKQSVVTHGNVTNQVCCALYSLWVKRILDGIEVMESYKMATNNLLTIYKSYKDQDYLNELEYSLRPLANIEGHGGGYVIDSFRSVKQVIEQTNNYRDAIIQSILLGDDTDTTAAIAGGVAGAYYGYDNIPEDWLQLLRDKELVNMLIEKLNLD